MSDIDRFRLVLGVARLRSITETAAVYGVTQPTVSRAIAHAERISARRLFVRSSTGSEPAPEAAEALAAIARMVDAYDELLVLAGSKPVGLRFAHTGPALPPILSAAIDSWNRAQPLPAEIILCADPIGALRSGLTDFAVARSGPDRPDDLYCDPIRLEPSALVVNPRHPLASDPTTTRAAAAAIAASGVYVVDTVTGCSPPTPFDHPCPRTVRVSGSAEWLAALIATPTGFGFTSVELVPSLATPDLVFRRFPDVSPVRVDLINAEPASGLVTAFRRTFF